MLFGPIEHENARLSHFSSTASSILSNANLVAEYGFCKKSSCKEEVILAMLTANPSSPLSFMPASASKSATSWGSE